MRSTIFTVPANSVVHVTIYQYDAPTGLRNPFLSQVQGTVGGTATVDGKTVSAIHPEEASHTFAVPELGVFVPLPGVAGRSQEPVRRSALRSSTCDHRTITFSFRTGKKGRFRWQCFVPCGAGYVLRQRRPDADARLHGRVHQCRLSMAAAAGAGAPLPSRTTRGASSRSGWSPTLIALPLVIFVLGPILPPGNGSEQATGQVTDNTVLLAMATPVLLLVVIYLLYAVINFRQPQGRRARRPGDPRRRAACRRPGS